MDDESQSNLTTTTTTSDGSSTGCGDRQLHSHAAPDAAALRIQAWWRGSRARSTVARRKQAARTLAQWWLRCIQARRARRDREERERTRKLKQWLQYQEERIESKRRLATQIYEDPAEAPRALDRRRHEAATAIQRRLRGQLARREVKAFKQHRRSISAAITIQRAVRKFLQRRRERTFLERAGMGRPLSPSKRDKLQGEIASFRERNRARTLARLDLSQEQLQADVQYSVDETNQALALHLNATFPQTVLALERADFALRRAEKHAEVLNNVTRSSSIGNATIVNDAAEKHFGEVAQYANHLPESVLATARRKHKLASRMLTQPMWKTWLQLEEDADEDEQAFFDQLVAPLRARP